MKYKTEYKCSGKINTNRLIIFITDVLLHFVFHIFSSVLVKKSISCRLSGNILNIFLQSGSWLEYQGEVCHIQKINFNTDNECICNTGCNCPARRSQRTLGEFSRNRQC